MSVTKRLKCEKNGCFLLFPYVKYGTKGFVKTLSGEIRECKCLGGELKPNIGWGTMEYMWKVADVDEIQYGTKNTIPIGVIYKSLDGATYGTCRGSLANSASDVMEENCSFSPISYLGVKYGINKENVNYIGSNNNIIELKTFRITNENKVVGFVTDFNLSISKDLVNINIPIVDSGKAFISSDDAQNSIKPPKVFYLDDNNDDEDTSSYTKLVIEIKESKLDDLREIAHIVDKIC